MVAEMVESMAPPSAEKLVYLMAYEWVAVLGDGMAGELAAELES